MRRRIDVQRRFAARPGRGPGARPVKQPVAQDDGRDTRHPQHLPLHVVGAFHRHGPRRVGQVERVGLGMRLAARRIGKRDALHDEAANGGGKRRRNHVAGALGADARIPRIGGGQLRLVEFARQVGELMDDDLGTRAADRVGHRLRVVDVKNSGRCARTLDLLGGLG